MGCAESTAAGAGPQAASPAQQKPEQANGAASVSQKPDAAPAPSDTAPVQDTTAAPQQQSLYDRLGGAAAVEAAVDIFYNKIMADPELIPFFEGIDMARQRRKQVHFMEYAFGGSKQYSGQALAAAHRKLIQDKGLKEAHFDMVAGHLVATLAQLKVPQGLINEVVAVVGPTKAVIFGGEAA